ncbi:MAG: hypothetical protein DHS20C01_01070 [marine bacterium B5-7]|nr:MAG: hypothetical protein DHS20C01_01070 [marine bacterium B5-7]
MAIAIGKGLQSRNVPIYSVRSASTCDAIATAEALGVGSVQIEESLNPIPSNTDNATDIAKLKQSVTIDIPDGSNILMVTFGSNINRLINAKISNPSGTLHAFHKTESGLAYVGSIAPDEWQK